MKIKKFLKKIYFVYFKKPGNFTVYLRGRLKGEKAKEYEALKSEYFLDKSKKRKEFLDKNINLEIGFGNGKNLFEMASMFKDEVFVGVEMYRFGVYLLMKKLKNLNLKNVFVSDVDIRKFLKKNNLNFSKVFILFPDPWPKKKHNKRRLIKKEFLSGLVKHLKVGGKIILVTDIFDYGEEMRVALLELQSSGFIKIEADEFAKNLDDTKDFSEAYINIFKSTFAKRAFGEGRGVSFFVASVVSKQISK